MLSILAQPAAEERRLSRIHRDRDIEGKPIQDMICRRKALKLERYGCVAG